MSITHSVVFFGTPAFAVPSLEALVGDPKFHVQLVVTQPDRPVGRKKILTPPPVKIFAERHGIPVLQPEKVNQLPTSYLLPPPSYFVVVAYGQILSQELLNIPRLAAVNLHASLLPKWRGASPIQHAILLGDKETGVTVQRMVREVDKGPILGQKTLPIPSGMTFADLHDRLKITGAALLVDTLKSALKPVAQDEHLVTVCKKLSRKDAAVDPNSVGADDIDRRVRALNPWPGVICSINGVSLKILKTSLEESPDAYPLRCHNGSIVYLMRVQESGKRALNGAVWARGKE